METRPFQDILSEHENMIYYLMNKLGIRDPEQEFYQEGIIALWKATNNYDPNKGKFSTYAYFLIHKTLISLIRKKNRQTEKENAYIASASAELSMVSTMIQPNIDPYLLNKIEKALSKKQMIWFTLFVLDDVSIKEIARRHQVSTDAVKNWARLAKPKLRKIMADHGC
ncbi:sigma-70 family RNA polymerase sigma factor [Radiobacillus sp. PE A8.2]|uniref:sigma-70 family RNA polymerase sigma factor n=1 Tax=Radiobacillus sp. PE A8.2 TaxID=3380349 RepID=UPI0038905715